MSGSDYIVFRVSGPMAAFGSPAVGERRPVDDRPTRSGILGLVAACLGIDRSDDSALHALSENASVAVRNDAAGRLFLDFHTVQAPRLGKRPFVSRREELEASKISTVVSYREYRSETTATVVLAVRGDKCPGVEEITEALRHPVYAPYLGRRSCPVGEPFWPLIVRDAVSIEEALAAYDEARPDPSKREHHRHEGVTEGRRVAIGSDTGMARTNNGEGRERRRDRLESARTRHFGLREEIISSWFGGPK